MKGWALTLGFILLVSLAPAVLAGGGGAGGGGASSEKAFIHTSDTEIYLGDGLNKAISTLMKFHLPALLASGMVTVSGTNYTYDQYLVLGSRTVVLGKSGESIDPVLYVDMGTSSSAPVYTSIVIFNRVLNISDTDVHGKTLNLFGKSYIIENTSGTINEGYNPLVLSNGNEKITLKNGMKVRLGQNETPIDNTLVTITGDSSGILKLQVSVAAQEASLDHIDVGSSYVDPVFKSFKVGFDNATPALESTERSTIEIAPSGALGATLTMTDYRGYEATITFAYDNDSATATATPILGDANSYMIRVTEGATVAEGEFVILSASVDFTHLFQVTDIDNLGESTAVVELTDQFSGDIVTISLDGSVYSNGTFYVDGQTYYIETVNGSAGANPQAKFTWGNGASYGITGDETMLFPVLKDKNGALVAFVGNQSSTPILTNATVYQVPGGDAGVSNITVRDDGVGYEKAGNYISVGRLNYYFNEVHNQVDNLTLNNISAVVVGGYPVVLILEEKGQDTSDTTQRDAVFITTAASGTTSPIKMTISSTVTFTAGTTYEDNNRVSNTSIYDEIDRYGTYVIADSYDQGNVTLYYPDTQTAMNIYVENIAAQKPLTITRTLSENKTLANRTIEVSLDYVINNNQIGLIVEENIPSEWELINSSPNNDAYNSTTGIIKWLLKDKNKIENGSIIYYIKAPETPATSLYYITGEWDSIDNVENNHSGNITPLTSQIEVTLFSISGYVKDVLGEALSSATMLLLALNGSLLNTTSTGADGYYMFSGLNEGNYIVNASKAGYVTESENITLLAVIDNELNFMGNLGLIPIIISDNYMLRGVYQWAIGNIDDLRILEVIHQWAKTI